MKLTKEMDMPLIKKIWQRLLYPVRPYWTSSIYGFGKWIRRYGYYPPFLPIYIYTDHGPGENSPEPSDHELASGAPVQFYHSGNRVDRWRAKSTTPCYAIYSPFVFARKSLRINRDVEVFGSIYFVAHSTPSIDALKSVERYDEELKMLPDRFWPITICLHIHDIRKGVGELFSSIGYKVVTAGDSLDQDFPERFYRILAKYKYAFSDMFGSYGLYATEMGVPFGLYGAQPELINKSDPNIELGKYTSFRRSPYYIEAMRLFSDLPGDSPSDEQRAFAEYYLGMSTGVSRTKMSKILYGSLFQKIFKISLRL